ncbi:GntR family transcriptional regulator [Salipiger mangrovisoli]|uniref:GntR family transcriptional regulator n=1 Tax=Salipiger mangrovisoli TaxID=2865933 RepID=A0ABR9X5N6_9RHOB|nr:GntR family transcriptional regulator [Salipiger mangrovisoli]MBE9638834.1 GntR family transcriptional regulator [Salipiger mangrovisoli]
MTEQGATTGTWTRKISRENLSETAYQSIRTALMHARLLPGTKLRLRQLAEEFGISATPMREALIRLVQEKALHLDARGTAVVPELTLDELHEIRGIRLMLEGDCAARAAVRAGVRGATELKEIHDGIPAALAADNFAEAVNLNTAFHLSLCRLAELPITYDIIEGLWVRCGPILSHLYDDGLPPHDGEHPHLSIIQAIRHGDAERARAHLQADILRMGAGLDRFATRPS